MLNDTDVALKNFCKVVQAYWDAFEFFCATHPIPILPIASDTQLDSMGKLVGIHRNDYENVDEFRKRIWACIQ